MYGDNISRSVTPMAVPSSHTKGVVEPLVLHDILEESGRMADSDGDRELAPDELSFLVAELEPPLQESMRK